MTYICRHVSNERQWLSWHAVVQGVTEGITLGWPLTLTGHSGWILFGQSVCQSVSQESHRHDDKWSWDSLGFLSKYIHVISHFHTPHREKLLCMQTHFTYAANSMMHHGFEWARSLWRLGDKSDTVPIWRERSIGEEIFFMIVASSAMINRCVLLKNKLPSAFLRAVGRVWSKIRMFPREEVPLVSTCSFSLQIQVKRQQNDPSTPELISVLL